MTWAQRQQDKSEPWPPDWHCHCSQEKKWSSWETSV
jgi:hypothetical protein